MDTLVTLLINGLAQGALIFLMASGLSIILGFMGVINFAHGTLFLWGGYTYVWSYYTIRAQVILRSFPEAREMGSYGGILNITSMEIPGGATLPFYKELYIFIFSVIIAVAVVFLMGYIFERLFINKVYSNAPAQILITLGLQLVFTDLVRLIWGPSPFAINRPPFLDGVTRLGNARIVHYNVFLIVVGLIVALVIHRILSKSKIGMVIRAGLQSPDHVQAIGINIKKYFTFVFAFGAALAGIGGALYMPFVGNVVSTVGMNNQILAFIVVIIGGLGNFYGTAMASVFIGLMGVAVAMFAPAFAVVANVLVMALVLIFKPEGLFGTAVSK
ncbi:branched-chain amino acid ABC transporter permease [Alkalicella caledoniensis]|uniref:Branched-chain amino acid ABC transporter permease n=1 Tax=Alkalicella caledoniensis TaxID=2731377 RepID=A0A7G9W5C2_ALKCA|nr:branched-chain amino acid ABC transporter permease [Alkalicella caledoniensis]QNO13884.1 branched-chain amino acid ABC transporter permease [Alkalicella caledoniensis]